MAIHNYAVLYNIKIFNMYNYNHSLDVMEIPVVGDISSVFVFPFDGVGRTVGKNNNIIFNVIIYVTIVWTSWKYLLWEM